MQHRGRQQEKTRVSFDRVTLSGFLSFKDPAEYPLHDRGVVVLTGVVDGEGMSCLGFGVWLGGRICGWEGTNGRQSPWVDVRNGPGSTGPTLPAACLLP